MMANFPKIWFKVMDPYVDSIQKGEKLSPEVEKELKRWCIGLMVGISITFTIIFIGIGFSPVK